MEQIVEQEKIISKILGEQKLTDGVEYRKLTYTASYPTDGGYLLYNSMTRELLFLTDGEHAVFENCLDYKSELFSYFVSHWFLVAKNTCDHTLLRQTMTVALQVNAGLKDDYFDSFVIFTTSDCNARCFYCFEHGCKRISMTEETAHDVADFIVRKSKGNKVTLNWFGGEPLFNEPAISTICADLRQRGIEYKSAMVSNGYLLDEETVQKAKSEWNLQRVQITLDGTEPVYNKIKAYIYKDDPSPFKRVLSNIENVLKNDVTVIMRLNVSDHNADNIGELIDFLTERFKEYDNASIYLAMLYENCSNRKAPLTREQRKELYGKFTEMLEKLDKLGKSSKSSIAAYLELQHCMADDASATSILPDGRLGKCEHYIDDHTYGTIYDDETAYDRAVIDSFREVVDRGENCNNCISFPLCFDLKLCPGTRTNCYDEDRQLEIRSIEKLVRHSYKVYLKKQS